jgi:DNA-binding transcriptional ArsR family regulator
MIPVIPHEVKDLTAGAFRLWICMHFLPLERGKLRAAYGAPKASFNRHLIELRQAGYVTFDRPLALRKRIDARGTSRLIKSDLALELALKRES